MSQEKQTKRLKTKKIASYALLAFLVVVFVTSVLANTLTASASNVETSAYSAYIERVEVTNETGNVTTTLHVANAKPNGYFTRDYTYFFDDGYTYPAKEILVKGWLLVDGGASSFKCVKTYQNGTVITSTLKNVYDETFITADIDGYASKNGYTDYKHNAQFSLYIPRSSDKLERNSTVDKIEIKAKLNDGREVIIFAITNVEFALKGGYMCNKCNNPVTTKTDTFINHTNHKYTLYCKSCDYTYPQTLKEYHIDTDNNKLCDFCNGGINACVKLKNEKIKPVSALNHVYTADCIDCGVHIEKESSHLYTSDKVCSICDYTELTYKSFDEGYTAGYDEALKAIAYGIFTDVKVNYAIQYNWELGEQWDEHTASNVEVNESGISFSQYYDDIDKYHNKFLEKHTDDDYYNSVRRLKITVTFADWFVWQERMLTVNFNVPKDYFLENYLESVWVYSPDGTSYEVTTTQTGNSCYDVILDDYFGQTQDVEAPIGQIGFIFYLTEYDDINTILNTMKFGINSSVMVYGASNSYYNQGYADGISQGERDYHSAYEKGMSEGMVYGRDEAYNQGYVDGFEKGQNSDNMFTTLFTGIFDSITLAFYSMLNFEILGVNVAMFALSLITLGLIIIVVKKFI